MMRRSASSSNSLERVQHMRAWFEPVSSRHASVEMEKAAAMGPSAERLLRLAALTREPASDYSLDVLKDVAQKKPAAQRLHVRVQRGNWKAEAA